MTLRMKRLIALLVAVGWLPSAFAVKTQRWELKSPEDYARGKVQNLSITSEGELRLGFGSQRLGEFAREVWCATVGRDGTIYFGTGSPAGVHAVGADGKVTRLFTNDAVAVTALALDEQNNLYAGTLAEGKIFKVAAGAAPETAPAEFCRLAAPYLWALLVDKQNHLFAATGPTGKIYRISPGGEVDEWYAAEDSNFLCLALDAEGALLAGGSDRGQLYRITGKEQGTVLHQFEEEEVRAVAVQGDKLFVGVNKSKIKRPRGPALAMRILPTLEGSPLAPTPGGTPPGAEVAIGLMGGERPSPLEMRWRTQLSSALYVRDGSGRMDLLADWPDETLMDLKIDADHAAIVALAGKGRVYRVADQDHWELLLDVEEQQALALALREGRLVFVGAGNVGAGYRVEPQRAATGEFTTEVFDAKFPARWGNASWQGRGAVQVRARTGNTSLPGATWSEWSAPLAQSPAAVASPPGRYIQMRAELPADGEPVLTTLALHYRVQNQKPMIDTLEVDGKPKAADKSAAAKTAAAVQAALDGDDEPRKPDSGESAAPSALSPKSKASPTRTINWQAKDNDSDKLVYRLFSRAEGEDVWIAFPEKEPLTKSPYQWDTDSIPDGWYRVKVAASDEESNPAGEALTEEKVSDSVKVDNRRPDVLELKFDPATGQLTGRARDSLSLIASFEYAVDGGEWKYFAPQDGIFDDREERFAVKPDDLKPGPHSLAVRATDEEGNVGVEKVSLK